MELIKEILIGVLVKEESRIEVNISENDIRKTVETACYKALSEIKEIIQNTAIDDFKTVEEIINVFQKYNIDFGYRHDF